MKTKDILTQIVKDSLDEDKSNFPRVLDFLNNAAYYFFSPYIIPTIIKKMSSNEEKDHPLEGENSGYKFSGAWGGFMAMVASVLPQSIYYHDHPEFIALPIATNVISGACEIRKAYKNTKQNLEKELS